MRFRNLERYRVGGQGSTFELRMPRPTSPSGKTYQTCPNEACAPRLFLLGEHPGLPADNSQLRPLMRREPGTPGVTCPYCGTDGDDASFIFDGDVSAVTKHIEHLLAEDVANEVHDSFTRMAKDVNRRARSSRGLIKFEMEVKHMPSRTRRHIPWRPDLLRNLACDACGREYGVYAIGLFCPDCGSRNVSVHFQRERDLIGQQIALATDVSSEGHEELAYRLLGNAHEDVLTAFETYLKTIYRFIEQHAPAGERKKPRANAFQNVKDGRDLYGQLGIDPYEVLDEADTAFLVLNIQKRHVIGHNLGIVDERYKEAVEAEEPGKTVPLLADEIVRFADLCELVVRHLEGTGWFQPPSTVGD